MELPDYYGWVLLLDILIAFFCLLVGFVVVGPARSKAFTQQYLLQNYKEEFQQAFGRDPDKQGYPDMGNGKLSQKLTFKQWYQFNIAQRTHYNFIQQVYVPLVCIPIAGYKFDIATIAVASVYIVGRIIATIGYARWGPNKRGIGVTICDFAMLGLLGLAFTSCYYFTYDQINS